MTAQTEITTYQSLEFWNKLCPDLSINGTSPLAETAGSETLPVRAQDWETCRSTIHEDGYFAYDGFFKTSFVDKLRDCFLKLEEQNIPPVFSFVYDEFWHLFLQLDPLLSDLVDDYQFSCAVWSWLVRFENQTAFAPHRDQVRDVATDDDEHLDYLTIWIPLTDLSHLSSGIFVLPAAADPDYDEGTPDVAVSDLQEIRSLQGSRGSVFCWTTGLVHWGSKQTRHGPPRMSVGLYVQNPEAEWFDPPLDLERPFPLTERLSLIGQQIINYSREADAQQLAFAQSLVELANG